MGGESPDFCLHLMFMLLRGVDKSCLGLFRAPTDNTSWTFQITFITRVTGHDGADLANCCWRTGRRARRQALVAVGQHRRYRLSVPRPHVGERRYLDVFALRTDQCGRPSGEYLDLQSKRYRISCRKQDKTSFRFRGLETIGVSWRLGNIAI